LWSKQTLARSGKGQKLCRNRELKCSIAYAGQRRKHMMIKERVLCSVRDSRKVAEFRKIDLH